MSTPPPTAADPGERCPECRQRVDRFVCGGSEGSIYSDWCYTGLEAAENRRLVAELSAARAEARIAREYADAIRAWQEHRGPGLAEKQEDMDAAAAAFWTTFGRPELAEKETR